MFRHLKTTYNEKFQSNQEDCQGSMQKKVIVILVDDKNRDLVCACWLKCKLEKQRPDITVILEPLEAYKAVLFAYRPAMIIFNHLLASHLVRYSIFLNSIGVKVGVLPNEGINYEAGELEYNAAKAHSNAHIDVYFCWNEIMGDLLKKRYADRDTIIKVVGIPRFDAYVEPLKSRLAKKKSLKPKILIATNFGLVHFNFLPRSEADEFFKNWVTHIPAYQNYWRAIEIHKESREKLLEYVEVIAKSGEYEVVLRPHPREDDTFYKQWIKRLPETLRAKIELDKNTPIAELITACDLEISMDQCTTALESWIAGVPTIELEFEKHPMLSNRSAEHLNLVCSSPSNILSAIKTTLQHPEQSMFAEARAEHIRRFTFKADGKASDRVCETISDLIPVSSTASYKLPASYIKKGIRLKIYKLFGKTYAWKPFIKSRQCLFPNSGTKSYQRWKKSISTKDVSTMMRRIKTWQ